MSKLTFTEYQKASARTAIYPNRQQSCGHCGVPGGLAYVSLGLGEAGEVQGKVKKIIRDAGGVISAETKKALVKELGDILWYVSNMCDELDVDMGTVAQLNILKLEGRSERGALQGDGDDR